MLNDRQVDVRAGLNLGWKLVVGAEDPLYAPANQLEAQIQPPLRTLRVICPIILDKSDDFRQNIKLFVF